MTASSADAPAMPRGPPFGIHCLASVTPWLSCGNCVQQDPPLAEYPKEDEQQPTYIKVRKAGPRLSVEEEQEAREKAKVERAKAAWKRISRQASLQGQGDDGVEQRSSAGFRKAADALIRAARKREEKQRGTEQGAVPMLRRDALAPKAGSLQHSRSDQPEVLDMQAEVMATGFASPSLSAWEGGEAGPSLSLSPRLPSDAETLGATRAAGAASSGRSPAGSSRHKPWSQLAVQVEEPIDLGPPPPATPPLASPEGSKRGFGASEESGDILAAYQKAGLNFDTKLWSMPSPRNSIDSPRLSQSQALLAKLGGPVSSPSLSLSPVRTSSGGMPKSPRRSAPRSPRSPSRESKDFNSLQQDAYSILMQQNQSRIKEDRQRRYSVEVSKLNPA